MKQARISVDVVVPIADDEELPGGKTRITPKIHVSYRETVKQMIHEKAHLPLGDLDTLLEVYVGLSLLKEAGVSFQPLTTEEALKINNCIIEEVSNECLGD